MNLIINADDYGISKATNKAVAELARIGTLFSTTVMVNMPFASEIIELLNLRGFGIGLHFNLTQGKPVSQLDQVSSLVNNEGTFYPVKEFKNRIQRKLINPGHIKNELVAQFDLLKEWVGDRVDHIDSHQDVNKQAIVSNILCDFSKTLNSRIGLRVYNKVYLSPEAKLSHPGMTNILTYGMSRSIKETFFRNRNKKLRTHFYLPDGMLISQKQSTRHLLNVLMNMPADPHQTGVYEVMCHPAVSIEGLSETSLLDARVEEYEILKSDKFRKVIEDNELLTFSDLKQ